MEAAFMREITLQLDPTVILFYSRIAASSGLTLENVLSDALFKLAGELSLQALHKSLKNPLSDCIDNN